jgi:hypothetical protein
MLRLCRKTLACDSFPPPGTWVLRDTAILHGAKARNKAKIGLVLASLLFVLGLWMPYKMHQTFKHFIGQELERVNTVQREISFG